MEFLRGLSALFLRKIVRYRWSVVKANIVLCFGKFDHTLVKKIYLSLSRYAIEMVLFYNGKSKDFLDKVKFTNPHSIEQELNTGSSVILYAAHFGNWEYFCTFLPLVLKGFDVYGLYRKINNPWIDDYIRAKRSRYGLKLLEKNRALKYILQNDRPAVFIFIADQSPHIDQEGRKIKFLGIDTHFEVASERLVENYGFKPYYLQCKVLSDKYEVEFIKMRNTKNIMTEYADNLERQILEEPANWLWTHRRWKHRNNLYKNKYLNLISVLKGRR